MKRFCLKGKQNLYMFSARKTKGFACFSGAKNALFSIQNGINTWGAM